MIKHPGSKGLLVIFVLVIFSVWTACDYKQGSENPGDTDSLFLGISMGMDKQAFFDHCWELNHQEVVSHGPGNESVEYLLDSVLEDNVVMRFYPTFHEEKIYEMPVIFSYEAWAPWNKQFFADSLLIDMVPVFEKWYGKLNILNHRTMGKVYYRIDGRRRINLFKKDDQFVQAVFTDLRVEKKLMEEREKSKAGE